MTKRLLALLLAALMVFTLAACGSKTPDADASPSPSDTATETPDETSGATDEEETTSPAITQDRQGNPITLPETIDTVMTFGPSNAEVLVGLGLGDKIIAVDTYTFGVEGIADDLPQFDMSTPDAETIISMKPDVIFVTGMVQAAGDDPYKPLSNAGVCVIYMPSSNSLEAIKEDIRYLATVMGVPERSEALISEMDRTIDAVKAIAETITEKKNVYFEIGAAPYMYSFGTGVFLNEMLELIGAVNVFGDEESWISVADEAILAKNPDVILTSVNYIEDAVGEITGRPGWGALTAVENGDVYYIDTNSSNRPNQNVVKALREMALAVYPEHYAALSGAAE